MATRTAVAITCNRIIAAFFARLSPSSFKFTMPRLAFIRTIEKCYPLARAESWSERGNTVRLGRHMQMIGSRLRPRIRSVGPQPQWLVYDAAARKIAESILIDRRPGITVAQQAMH